MLSVTDTITIHGPLADVYRYFWDAEGWPRITPHVRAVEMVDSRPGHQRFRMEVHSPDRTYRMETEREGVECERISYRQTTPPPVLDEHTGEWTFREEGGGVKVELVHRVRINEQKARELLGVSTLEEAETLIGQTLSHNASLTMLCIKGYVEGAA